MVIACIGDSLTEGDYGLWGKSGIANVQKESYPYYLRQLMRCEVRNFGKCGYRSSTMLNYYDAGNVDVHGADIVLIMLGSNGGQSSTEDTFENQCYREIIARVRRDAPDAKLFLITPPNASMNPIYSNSGYMPQVYEAQVFTRKTAEAQGLPVIDLGAYKAFSPDWEYIMQPNDGLHCGKMGYAVMAARIYETISRYRELPLDTLKLPESAGGVRLVAHRGLSGIECENTNASFTAAGNRSYYGIETDIHRTSDGKYICSHDGRTGRVCNTNLVISDTDFDTLRSLDLNDFDGIPHEGLKLPTVQEYVRICRRYGKHCVAELKSDFTSDEIREIMDYFDREDYLDNTTFIGVSMDNLDKVRAFRPEQSCQYLCGLWNLTPDWLEPICRLLEEHKMDLDTFYPVITREAVDVLHAHGIRVNAWTVDCLDTAVYLAECGVDFITTNILE